MLLAISDFMSMVHGGPISWVPLFVGLSWSGNFTDFLGPLFARFGDGSSVAIEG